MFPDTWVWIVAITAIVFGSWAAVSIARLIATYLQGRNEGPSLTESELAGIIGRAVEEAVRPLEEKLDRIERRGLTEGPSNEGARLETPKERSKR